MRFWESGKRRHGARPRLFLWASAYTYAHFPLFLSVFALCRLVFMLHVLRNCAPLNICTPRACHVVKIIIFAFVDRFADFMCYFISLLSFGGVYFFVHALASLVFERATYVCVCLAVLAFPHAWSAGQWRLCCVANPVPSSRRQMVCSHMYDQRKRCTRWAEPVSGPSSPSTRMRVRRRLAHGHCWWSQRQRRTITWPSQTCVPKLRTCLTWRRSWLYSRSPRRRSAKITMFTFFKTRTYARSFRGEGGRSTSRWLNTSARTKRLLAKALGSGIAFACYAAARTFDGHEVNRREKMQDYDIPLPVDTSAFIRVH